MNYPVKYHFKRILTSVQVKNMNVNTNLTFSSHFLKYHKSFFVNLSLKCSFVYQFFLWKKKILPMQTFKKTPSVIQTQAF